MVQKSGYSNQLRLVDLSQLQGGCFFRISEASTVSTPEASGAKVCEPSRSGARLAGCCIDLWKVMDLTAFLLERRPDSKLCVSGKVAHMQHVMFILLTLDLLNPVS